MNERLDSLEQRLAEALEQNTKAMERLTTMQEQMQQMFEAMQKSGIGQTEKDDIPAPTADNDNTVIIKRQSTRSIRKAQKAANKDSQPERRKSSEKRGKFKGLLDFVQFRGRVWEKLPTLKKRQAKIGATALYHKNKTDWVANEGKRGNLE